MVRASEAYGYPLVKAMQHRKRKGSRKGEGWRKCVWLVFPHMPDGMKYPFGTMQ